jgi:hypothetical protein
MMRVMRTPSPSVAGTPTVVDSTSRVVVFACSGIVFSLIFDVDTITVVLLVKNNKNYKITFKNREQ